MSWSSRIIDELYRAKRAGIGFEEAWRAALRAHKPTPRQNGYRETLFPEDGDALSEVEWLYYCCSDAWHGRRPLLSNLRAELEDALAGVSAVPRGRAPSDAPRIYAV